MSSEKLTVGVIFGSRSVEHDVSVVTAQQVMKALNPAKYTIVPIYITRDGQWYTGSTLKELKNFRIDDIANLAGTKLTLLSPSTAYRGMITPPISGRFGKSDFTALDVVFPVVHGSHGEDGTLQGLFELSNLPYVGTGVKASAIANDKAMTKMVLKANGLPVIDQFLSFTRNRWLAHRNNVLAEIDEQIGFPAFVKPLTLGSSIGIARIDDAEQAALHIDIAANLENHILVEHALLGENMIEINCAVMGQEDDIRTSVLEQPVSYQEFLTYEEKYMRESGQGMKAQERIIPAPIDEDLAERIKATAVAAFRAIGGSGTARLDFLVNRDDGQFWVNEINTLPGSLAFYLWEPDGLSPSAVCDALIEIALAIHKDKSRNTYDYESGLLDLAAARGLKGAKGKSG